MNLEVIIFPTIIVLFAILVMFFIIRIIKWIIKAMYDLAPWIVLFVVCVAGYLYISKVDDERNTETAENKSGCSWDRTKWNCDEVLSETTTGR